MTKQELIAKVAADAGITKVQAKAAVEAVQNGIAETLTAGEKIQLLGFGTFSVTERPEREGINPRTKEKITIAAKKVVKFKAASALEDSL